MKTKVIKIYEPGSVDVLKIEENEISPSKSRSRHTLEASQYSDELPPLLCQIKQEDMVP